MTVYNICKTFRVLLVVLFNFFLFRGQMERIYITDALFFLNQYTNYVYYTPEKCHKCRMLHKITIFIVRKNVLIKIPV